MFDAGRVAGVSAIGDTAASIGWAGAGVPGLRGGVS